MQFSKHYNQVIEIPVEYINVPPDKLLINNPDNLHLRMKENGFRVAWFSMFPPTLQVDVSKAVEDDGVLRYIIDEHRGDILAQLNIDFDDSQFVKDELAINYEQRQEKKLPVILRIETEYAAGFGAVKGFQISPDSITVSGPDNIIDTLSMLYTRPVKLKNIKEDISSTVGIDTSGIRHLTLYQENVNYSVDVEKFTEGNVVVPIELINVPNNLNVVIFPKETLLFYQVNLKDYNKVTPSDFRVVADFSKVRENQDFLLPEITKEPEFTTNHRINEKRIQFIIKK